jgi:hypothetical protein
MTWNGDDPFAVALGWAGHQQRDDLAVRPLILADAEVGQLDQFLAAQPGQAQRFHDRPLPERLPLLVRQPHQCAGAAVEHPDRLTGAAGLLPVVLGGGALPGDTVDREGVAESGVAGGVQQRAQALPLAGDVLR